MALYCINTGYFTNGNPGTGVAATILDADFMNMVMMELTNVVSAGGLTPSKTTYNQVLSAINGLITKLAGHGQCILSTGGTTNLTLFPMNGNNLIINGVTQQVPQAGVSYTLSGTTAGSTYNVYAFMNSGVMTLMLSTTGHSTASNGVETMTGDTTKTLVGKIYTSASNTILDNGTNRTVISWFNRRLKAINTGSAGNSTSSLTSVLLGLTVTFLSWSADSYQAQLSGIANNSTVNDGASIGILVDGAGGGFTSAQMISNPASSSQQLISIAAGSVAEGVHTLQAQGAAVTGGNATFSVTFTGFILG
jgi:hypothetical protein